MYRVTFTNKTNQIVRDFVNIEDAVDFIRANRFMKVYYARLSRITKDKTTTLVIISPTDPRTYYLYVDRTLFNGEWHDIDFHVNYEFSLDFKDERLRDLSKIYSFYDVVVLPI